MTDHTSTLLEIATKHGTDKATTHDYIRHYQHHFQAYRDREITLLEIGIGGYDDPESGGESLKTWHEYFHNGHIYGLDYHQKNGLENERTKVFQGSQADPRIISTIIDTVPNHTFDIIIDDGSHRSDHIISTFNMLFQYVSNGGWYVIEDTQTSYWGNFGGNIDPYSSKYTTMNYFKSLVDGLNWAEVIQPGYQPSYTDLFIESITFYHNLIFIKKNKNIHPSNLLVKNKLPETWTN